MAGYHSLEQPMLVHHTQLRGTGTTRLPYGIQLPWRKMRRRVGTGLATER